MSSLRFTTLLPWWLTIPGLLLVAGLIWIYYRRETRHLAGWPAWLLPTLRSVAVVLLLLTFLGPVITWRWIDGELGRVIFVVDRSDSMQVADVEGAPGLGPSRRSPSRLEAARRFLFAGDRPLVDRLRQTHRMRVVAGSGSVTDTEGTAALETIWDHRDPAGNSAADNPGPARLDPQGTATDLDQLIRQAAGYLGEAASPPPSASSAQPHGAVVLLSDGRQTSDATPLTTARQLAAENIPIYTLAIGEPTEPPDVAVVRANVPDRVFFRNRLQGSLSIKESLPAGQSYEVQISHDAHLLWEQTVTSGSPGVRDLAFEIGLEEATKRVAEREPRSAAEATAGAGSPQAAAGLRLDVAVTTTAEEADLTNNDYQFGVWSITQATRLLIVDGRSRWETRYLRNLFARDPQWQVDTTIAGPASEAQEIPRTLGPGGFPDKLEELSRYDAVVLGEIPPGLLSRAQLKTLKQRVDRGGGLVVIDGTRGHLQQQLDGPLGDLIPVQYRPGQPVAAEDLRPQPTRTYQHLIALDGIAERSDTIWRNLIPPRALVPSEALPGTEVLVSATTARGPLPWLAIRRYGGGRVAYLAADETWRWRMDVADLHHGRFWTQLLRSVIPPLYPVGNAFVDLDSGPRSRPAGEQAEIRARLRDRDGRPQSDALVDAVVLRDQQPFATISLAVSDPQLGTYTGLTPPLPAGAYTVQVRASGYTQEALAVQSPIAVEPTIGQETLFQAADPGLLRDIAEAAKGRSLSLDSPEALLEALAPLATGRVVEVELPLWQSFPWFLVLIGLLSLEWLLRKGAGLI